MKYKKRKLTEGEIDRLVVAEANDMTKWGEPVSVKTTSIRLSPSIIQKAKYLARLHKTRGYQTWIKQVLQERIRLEEEILSGFKKESRAASGK